MFQRFSICIIALLLSLTVVGQNPRPRFDPAKFQADLEQYITTKAALTPKEAAAFFPLYREMMNKQRVIFGSRRRYRHVDLNDDKACEEAIAKLDEADIQMKELQRKYHRQFLQVLPARKVLQIIKAEERFHRQAFRRAVNKDER
ncbi:MAG: hypothetical protein MSD82_08685 [Prevotella sp.]|nr:hypothetical protein [Prevotella sp.]